MASLASEFTKKDSDPILPLWKKVMAIGRAAKCEEEIGFVDGEWWGKVGIGFICVYVVGGGRLWLVVK